MSDDQDLPRMFELSIDLRHCSVGEEAVTIVLSEDGLMALEQWIAGLRLGLYESRVLQPGGEG